MTRPKALGAKLTDSVSQRTHLLVIAEPGSKPRKAGDPPEHTITQAACRQLANLHL